MSQTLYDSATGSSSPASEVIGPIKEKIRQAQQDRSRLEPIWHSNRAFAAGKPWLKWSRGDRKLRLDPRDIANGSERYTVDILTQNLWTALGQLAGAEERRQLLFRREDIPSEDFTKAANDALAYGWDHEWRAPEKLAQIKRKLLVDGTAAVQVYFDPTQGKELGDIPLGDGMPVEVYGDAPEPGQPQAPPQIIPTQPGVPITDGTHARAFMAHRTALGQTPKMKHLNEGRICWHARSVFQFLVPPGIEDEERFPWEAIIEAVSIDTLIERYGAQAKGLKEEPLAVLEQLGLKDSIDSGFGSDPESDPGVPGKLDGHVALITYFERPNQKFPKGRVVTYAGEKLLGPPVNELPYVRPNGERHSGIVYFHYWKIEGRFYGRALIEGGKGIQRAYNKRVQQEDLTIRRGQPYILAEDTSELKKTETPLEVVNFKQGIGVPPAAVGGIPVHESIWRSKEGLLADLDRAMGQHAVSRGEEGTRQTTFAELNLRAAQDRLKLDPITDDFQMGVAILTEITLADVRRYWPRDKMIAISGEEGTADAVEFKASDLPEFFLTEIAEGSRARTQGAEIQLIADLWAADQASPQPRLDLTWLEGSYKAGKALDFPESPTDTHEQKARWENSQMTDTMEPVEPVYFDPPDTHIPVHRESQVEALMAGNDDLYQVLEMHIQMHMLLADENATKAAAKQMASQADAEQAQMQEAQAQEQVSAEQDQQRQLELLKAKQPPPGKK